MSKHVCLPTTMFALTLLALACDEAKQVDGEAASLRANTTIAAKDFELAALVALVERKDVRDAESLEALINAEDSTIQVDVDADGKRDFVQVREVGEVRLASTAKAKAEAETDGALKVAAADGEAVQFEFRAVPSSKLLLTVEPVEVETVVLASLEVTLREADRQVVVEARYAPTVIVVAETEVEHVYVHHIELEHRHDHLVVVDAPFVAWVWIDARPLYVGHVHLPPGHAKQLGLYWYEPGHGHGHGHHEHKHHDHHDHHDHHGGPDKIEIKVKSGHGGGKMKFKGGKH
ncbi:hypothetical protein ACNOYE_02260 [Nannocystaceae bacterium ST9]